MSKVNKSSMYQQAYKHFTFYFPYPSDSHAEQKGELENFTAAREKSKSSFFSVMRNRLRLQNLPKYTDRLKLDKALLVLQRALRNEVQKWKPEEGDWQPPLIIEQYYHAKVSSYLPTQRFFVDLTSVQKSTGVSPFL